jgi:hypothetical protein
MLKEFLQSCIANSFNKAEHFICTNKSKHHKHHERIHTLETMFLKTFGIMLKVTGFYMPAFGFLASWIEPMKTVLVIV